MHSPKPMMKESADIFLCNPDTKPSGTWWHGMNPYLQWELCAELWYMYTAFSFYLLGILRLAEEVKTEPNCKITEKGIEYKGTINITSSGRQCQRWDLNTPHKPLHVPIDYEIAENYCRNPSNSKRPWCYTMENETRWEYCNVPKCDFECNTTVLEYEYNNITDLNVTKSGVWCLRRDQLYHQAIWPGYTNAENYCWKSYNAREGPWCLIKWIFCHYSGCVKEVIWDPSNYQSWNVTNNLTSETIALECKTTELGREYRGTINITKSGKWCQRWDSETPHVPTHLPDDYPYAENYCRNAGNSPSGPWCYTINKKIRWESCVVPKCGESYCPSETFEKISWWKTAAGEVDTKPCPPGYKGDATRRCSTDSKWLQPVYIDCIDIMLHETTEKVKELANITDPEKASSAINNILDTVQNTTDKVNQEPLKSGDLVKTTEILENILQISDDKNAPINSQTVGNVLNSVLSPDNNEGWNEVNNEQNTQNKSAANIMGIVEDLGLLIQKELSHDETKTITRSNIEIEVSTLKHDVVFPEEANTESQIRLPDQLGLEGKFYTAVHYKTISNILPRSQNRVIGSDVMSLSFERKEIHLLKNITIKFLRNKKIDLNDPTISCGYWNFSKKSWSYDGCSLKQSDGQHATCVCNHLTNFAILMSPTDVQLSDDHLLALEIITYVGCGLSVLGCILTLLIYCIFWRYVKNEWAVILVNLCIALIIGYSVFMGAAEETGNEIVCNFITALLHYVFLVVFFLMLCEGISVVISVTVVFKTKSKLPIYLSLAWIVPVAIVGATMGITTLKGYHARRYCWLNKDNFVFLAFVGPAILIIIVNVIAIILVLRAMYSSALMANEKIRKKARAGLKCMVTLLPVLGLSWLFGVLTFNEDTIVFQYLFGITTSFQGLFIFIFHVIFNKKVHEGFRKVMHRHRSKAQSNVTSRQKSSGSHVIGSKVNSTDTTNLKDVKTSTPTKKEFRNILGINRSKAYQVTTKT